MLWIARCNLFRNYCCLLSNVVVNHAFYLKITCRRMIWFSFIRKRHQIRTPFASTINVVIYEWASHSAVNDFSAAISARHHDTNRHVSSWHYLGQPKAREWYRYGVCRSWVGRCKCGMVERPIRHTLGHFGDGGETAASARIVAAVSAQLHSASTQSVRCWVGLRDHCW